MIADLFHAVLLKKNLMIVVIGQHETSGRW